MKRKRLIGAIAAACAIAAATAGIAQGSGSAHSSSSGTTTGASGTASAPAHPGGPGGMGGPMHGPPGAQAVHSVSVVLNKAKTAYVTETSDHGTLESVDAASVTLVEGTKSVTYKTVTVTIPADATITLDGKTSTLSALKAGDDVSVSSSSDGTVVIATDSSFHPEGGPPGQAGTKGQTNGAAPAPPSEGSAGSPPTTTTTTTTG